MVMKTSLVLMCFTLPVTPSSAAPPTAASGGGAQPRNELELFVKCLMFAVGKLHNLLLMNL
ncbi:hypothetical protein [Endozoicomonas sp.]|uniref:hypothetical protein n=1 Tax=Endozoicomonas sp. TaxID=1892382 RepID=UPI003AF83843